MQQAEAEAPLNDGVSGSATGRVQVDDEGKSEDYLAEIRPAASSVDHVNELEALRHQQLCESQDAVVLAEVAVHIKVSRNSFLPVVSQQLFSQPYPPLAPCL